MKTYFTKEAWRLAAVEDPRNPSFQILEIEFKKTGDVLVVTESEYNDIDDATSDLDVPEDQVLLDGTEYYGDQQDVLDVIKVYKCLD